MSNSTRTQIVILGGGFAGVTAAMAFQRRLRRNRLLDVHLVSDENYFLFQPLLPEIVACGIEPGHILNPIRHLCPHIQFHCANVESIEPSSQHVVLTGPDATQRHHLRYDHLVICLGVAMDLSRISGMAEHALPMKTLGDAFHLRNHILSKLEQADLEPDGRKRRAALTFVAVGGGFSGVETIAEVNDMVRGALRFYPHAQSVGPRVFLIHSRERILNELDAELARFAGKKLQQRGVELVLNHRVKEVTPTGIVLDDDRVIETETVICTVGNAPQPLLDRTSLPQDRGRLLADEYLRVQGCTNLWTLGDAALIPDRVRGGHCPPTAQYAVRQGRQCAENVLAAIAGRPLRPFAFSGLGQLAVVGRRCGVAQVFGMRFSGLIAWWLWRTVYWSKLPGLRCKIRVGLDWALDLLFPRDITKLDVHRTERLRRAHYRPGDWIIRQGEVGDRFYLIEKGEVEVIQQGADGSEKLLAVRAAGESFGEIALLHDTPRTAGVRARTPADVVAITRNDFRTLLGSFELFRSRVLQDSRDRGGEPPQAQPPT